MLIIFHVNIRLSKSHETSCCDICCSKTTKISLCVQYFMHTWLFNNVVTYDNVNRIKWFGQFRFFEFCLKQVNPFIEFHEISTREMSNSTLYMKKRVCTDVTCDEYMYLFADDEKCGQLWLVFERCAWFCYYFRLVTSDSVEWMYRDHV